MRTVPQILIDKSVFFKYLTETDTAEAKIASSLFRDALEGRAKLITSPLVIVELIVMLQLHHPKSRIGPILKGVIDLTDFPERDTCLRALYLWLDGDIEYTDAYSEVLRLDRQATGAKNPQRKRMSRSS